MRVVALIQARMGSTRLPGKVLETIVDRPLLSWTVEAVRSIPGLAQVVVATTTDGADDPIVETADALGVAVHRGPVDDVLTRCWDAVVPFDPDVVVRQTADNPFPDPAIAAAQVDALVDGQLDYVGIGGWPLGIAAEVCRADALASAAHESTDPAEREHVMPFIYRRPERFAIGTLARPSGPSGGGRWRFTVDTLADLAFARVVAGRLGHPPPVHLRELEALLDEEPELAALNADVEQKSWRVAGDGAGRPTIGGTEGERWTS